MVKSDCFGRIGRGVMPIVQSREIEKLNCILSKRATRPIYVRVQLQLNAISPYQSQQSSPAI